MTSRIPSVCIITIAHGMVSRMEQRAGRILKNLVTGKKMVTLIFGITEQYPCPRYIETACVLTLLQAARDHWSIENNLHWILGVSFHEDAACVRQGNSPQNMIVANHSALNLLKFDAIALVCHDNYLRFL